MYYLTKRQVYNIVIMLAKRNIVCAYLSVYHEFLHFIHLTSSSHINKIFQVFRPYVIIEIDDPGQRMQTLTANMSDSALDIPQWNQDFTL